MNEVIAVDLDGTLVKSDLLIEALVAEFKDHPIKTIEAVFSARTEARKRDLKTGLAHGYEIDPNSLPYDEPLISLLKEAKTRGAELWLVTASPLAWAESVAEHLGFFSGVMATEVTGENLRGVAKRDALVSKFGLANFTYIGDSKIDRVVGAAARRYLRVQDIRRGKVSLYKDAADVHLRRWRRAISLKLALRQLRPHHWLKNTLIFLAPLAAQVANLTTWINLLIGFFLFSMVASGLYIINDVLDLREDRSHSEKSLRPLASGALKIRGALMTSLLMVVVALVSSIALGGKFAIALAVYALTSLSYSLWGKKVPLLDLLALSFFYWIRVVAGASIAIVPVSGWFQLFVVMLFFSLAALKRFGEGMHESHSEDLGDLAGRGYLRLDLGFLRTSGSSSGILAAFILGIYSLGEEVQVLYSRPDYFLIISLALWIWLLRLWFVAGRAKMNADPVIFAIKDVWSVSLACICIVAFAVAR